MAELKPHRSGMAQWLSVNGNATEIARCTKRWSLYKGSGESADSVYWNQHP